MDLKALLKFMVDKDGSDLFLTTGAPPSMKAFGRIVPMTDRPFQEGEVKKIAFSIMNEEQRGEVGMVCRTIKTEIPQWQNLGLPEVLTRLVMEKNGLVLFVGGTGSGKSTSLASLIDYRNQNSTGHIITIEDPVEFVHKHKKCIVSGKPPEQRVSSGLSLVDVEDKNDHRF